jgi:hypothetical protein
MTNHKRHRTRRVAGLLIVIAGVIGVVFLNPSQWQQEVAPSTQEPQSSSSASPALEALNALPVKGKAPKTGYTRAQFGDGWITRDGCDTRNTILYRDMKNTVVSEGCIVTSGTLDDPYTGTTISFLRGATTSSAVQIDHVVALSNAWQTGAQALSREERIALANDPLELLASDGKANQQISDGDAATWLPPNKAFRCQYIARQIAVKQKYTLWVVAAEKAAMERVLQTCPGQTLPLAVSK